MWGYHPLIPDFTEGRWNYPCGESGYSIHPANVLEHRDTLMCGKLVI